ncbi:MAG: DUF2085 domain-containing protein [Anaerolineae bacterium]|nr:DUF2085 domain-containing protein [Anaerolineae bacterium]
MKAASEARPSTGRKLNMWLLKFSRHWLRGALIIIGLYAGLPYAAPVMMKVGLTAPARVLYTLYSPMCHQMAFRSMFIFGDQLFYPRAAAGTEMTPFEAYAAHLEEFASVNLQGFDVGLIFAARDFVGNEQMGYKMTLCARDTAIYTFLFLGGLIYSIPYVRRRIRPVPIWLYIFLGLGPIGIDGVSQLLSYPPFSLWPVRETAPFFRVTTGAIFGLMNAWLAFPYLEQSFQETRRALEAKFARAGIAV